MSDERDPSRDDPGLEGRPDSAADARAYAALLARRLAERAARVAAGVDLLERTELEAQVHLDDLVECTAQLARAGGIEVVLDEPEVAAADEDALHPAVIEAEQILREQRRVLGRGRDVRVREGILDRRLVVVISFVAFVAIGYLASVVGGMMPGDALSRVGAGQAVVISRDPHLEAIGFIWGPFPTMFQIPFAALRGLWLPLTSAGMGAIIVSAAFMAGTLGQLLAWGVETGSKRWFRLLVVGLVAIHPLIWTHGVNGMSEACWLFFMMLVTRHLARWIETDDTRSLVLVAVGISMGYLTRYETAAVFAAVLPLVAVISWTRSAGAGLVQRPQLTRRRETVLDLSIVSFPVVVTMLAWAGTSWAIVGEPFPQFTSQYGNSALVRASAASNAILIGDPSSAGRAWFFVRQLLVASPLLAVLALVALWGTQRSTMRATAAIAVLGSPLALQLLFAAKGSTFPWLRYVVMGVLLAGALAMVIGASERPRGTFWLKAVAIAVLVPGIFWTTHVVNADQYASFDQEETFAALALAVRGESVPVSQSSMRLGQEIAGDVDAIDDAEPGTVMMDQAAITVLPAAPRPNIYVIPSDRDFQPALAAPADFGIRYILLSKGTGNDSIAAQYPELWAGRVPGIEQVEEWGASATDDRRNFRLFRIVDPDPRNRAEPDPEFGR